MDIDAGRQIEIGENGKEISVEKWAIR